MPPQRMQQARKDMRHATSPLAEYPRNAFHTRAVATRVEPLPRPQLALAPALHLTERQAPAPLPTAWELAQLHLGRAARMRRQLHCIRRAAFLRQSHRVNARHWAELTPILDQNDLVRQTSDGHLDQVPVSFHATHVSEAKAYYLLAYGVVGFLLLNSLRMFAVIELKRKGVLGLALLTGVESQSAALHQALRILQDKNERRDTTHVTNHRI